MCNLAAIRAARHTIMVYGRILIGHLWYDDVMYPYRRIELETLIWYGMGCDMAENGCMGQTNTFQYRAGEKVDS